MKTNVFTPTVLFLFLALMVSSCRSSRNTGGTTSGKSYPPVYSERNASNLPPGQAKKIYGDKSAKKYAPGQRKKQAYPLIIARTPDIVIGRNSEGRNYYRNAAGFYYWEGSDSKFYLDEKHLPDITYNKSDYDNWKSKGNGNGSNSTAKSSNGKSNGNDKSKGPEQGNEKSKGKSKH